MLICFLLCFDYSSVKNSFDYSFLKEGESRRMGKQQKEELGVFLETLGTLCQLLWRP